MDKFADKFRIKSSRLTGWNYSNQGFYFITICTYCHNNFLGIIENNKIIYKQAGKIVKSELFKTFKLRRNLNLIAWVVMPNHVHVLFSLGDVHVETHCNASHLQKNIFLHPETHYNASLQDDHSQIEVISNYRNHPGFFDKLNIKSNKIVPKTIRLFKGSVKREAEKQKLSFGWQPGFFDEIIQDKKRLEITKKYIENNIRNWKNDKLYGL